MLLFFISGALLTSFFTCIATRQSLFQTKYSHCDFCQYPLRFLQNIPILSYLFLKGQTHCCHQKLPLHYLLLEIFGGIYASLCTFLPYDSHNRYFTLCVLIMWLLWLSIYDYFHYELPWSSLFILTFLCIINDQNWLYSLSILIFFQLLLYFYPYSLGGADIILFASLSLTLSAIQIPWLIFLSATFGLVFWLIQFYQQHHKILRIPFVPFISLTYLILKIMF